MRSMLSIECCWHNGVYIWSLFNLELFFKDINFEIILKVVIHSLCFLLEDCLMIVKKERRFEWCCCWSLITNWAPRASHVINSSTLTTYEGFQYSPIAWFYCCLMSYNRKTWIFASFGEFLRLSETCWFSWNISCFKLRISWRPVGINKLEIWCQKFW